MTVKKHLLPIEIISSKIFLLRNEKVLIDSDLSELYGVETKKLIQAVKRNIVRFPNDFMFQLTKKEFEILRSQIGTSSWGGRRYPPYVFTEQGVAMLSSVLNSERAIKVNIEIMRAFVAMRKYMQSNKGLSKKITLLEKELNDKISMQQEQIVLIFETINNLMDEETKPKREIGY
ncbi:MAG: DNA-binding protein [Ignavibacteriae bacterium HGW-Ignavibacteriae-2]|jgi:phage regulator Rha-like protein|nr:ORF6N domain-containing protein [Bacteroidota bacterium]PKL88407.1 MAG: DNA-binding protein [Ignavibacteriae bacterium HGW-Ignavibacteriae-2]